MYRPLELECRNMQQREEVEHFDRILHLQGCIKTRGRVREGILKLMLGGLHEKHKVKRRFPVLINGYGPCSL